MRKNKLRNFGKFLGVYLLSLVATLLLFTSCDTWTDVCKKGDRQHEDSVLVAKMLQDAATPKFTSMVEVIDYRVANTQSMQIDSIFYSLPQPTLENVITVLFKKNALSITKEDIVNEYQHSRNVYDNLPKPGTSESTIATDIIKDKDKDAGKTVISTSYTYRTDTIDGKPVRIKIKTEELYE